MALAVLYLILALVVFVGATVIAVAVMLRVQARRGAPKGTAVDRATVSMLRRRRQRLDRRLGIDPEPPEEDEAKSRPQADADTATGGYAAAGRDVAPDAAGAVGRYDTGKASTSSDDPGRSDGTPTGHAQP